MPTLPTFTVSQATADRILAAFSGQTNPDGTVLSPAQAYKTWLRNALSLHVTQLESYGSVSALQTDLPLTQG